MNQAVNSGPTMSQAIVLLALVAGFAGTGVFFINRWTQDLESDSTLEMVKEKDLVAGNSDGNRQSAGKIANAESTEAISASAKPGAGGTAIDTAGKDSLPRNGRDTAERDTVGRDTVGRDTAEIARNIKPSGPRAPTVVLPDFAVPVDPSDFETECERFVRELETRYPNNPLALNVVAMYFSQMQQTTKADDLWKRCVSLAPNDPIYYFNWASNYLNRSESELALGIMEQAIANGLDRSVFTYQIAISLANLSRDAEVEELIMKEPNQGANDPSLLLLLGQSQVKLGKIAEARSSFESAKSAGLYNKALVNGLLTCSVRLKDKEATEKYRTELESFASTPQEFGQKQFDKRSEVEMRRFGLGIIGESIEVLRRAGDLAWAESVGLRAIFLDPKNVDVYLLMTQVYRDKGEPQNEMVVYERICSLQPTDVLNHLYHARASADAGYIEKAEAILKYAIALAPLDPACYATMGEFLLEHRRASEAVWYLNQALSLEPSREGRLLYIRALRESGELEKAKAEEDALNSVQEIPRVRANQ